MRHERPALAKWTDDPPTVLVVDDDSQVRGVLELGLQRHGFAVVVAEDGREAVELFHRMREQDEGESPVVLLDVRMPGLDGPLVLAALQSLDAEVRAYFMTGDPAPYTADGLLALGARRVFAKPLDLAATAAELRRGYLRAGPQLVHGGK